MPLSRSAELSSLVPQGDGAGLPGAAESSCEAHRQKAGLENPSLTNLRGGGFSWTRACLCHSKILQGGASLTLKAIFHASLVPKITLI